MDTRGAGVGWAVVHARVVSPERQEQLAALRRAGVRFIGMTSDMCFPDLDEFDPLDYGALCEGWCHCFREPDRHLPPDPPRALISASDFTDWHTVVPETALRVEAPSFDFVYVGATAPWKQPAKGWDLARRCIPRLSDELGLRGLLVDTPAEHTWPGTVRTGPLPWRELMAHLARARFAFLPNALDASPRVLTEALCLDVPVVVNRRILGGWKYVNSFTGVFFDGPDDVVAAARACLDRERAPRAWFRANHGPYLAGQRLGRFLGELDPALAARCADRLGARARSRPPGPLSLRLAAKIDPSPIDAR
ncbi:hypothetical protein [Haliangium sp.]|uniref:hypothetical protein n=1 Tax=Haliangium sp. TaxID=2663208 RepID=UPI003D13189A